MINILHVDDDFADHKLVKSGLLKIDNKLSIHYVESVDKALKLLENKQFDCILSDYQMLDTDGLEFVSLIRQNHDLTPFIFLTGQGNEKLAAEAFRSGADDYFTKDGGFAHYERLLQSIRNVIRTREMKESLDSEKRYLESLLDCSPVAIALTKSNGDLIRVNPKFTDLFGFSQEECIGRKISAFLVPEECSEEAREMWDTVMLREYGPVESYRHNKKKKLIPVSIQGAPIKNDDGEAIGAYAIYLDIRARKTAEAEQKRLISLINNTNVFIGIFTFDGSMNYLNKAGWQMTGLDGGDEIEGLSISEFIPESVHSQLHDIKLMEQFKRGQFGGDHVITNMKTGKSIEVEFSLFPIQSSGVEVIDNIAVVLRDVSERAKTERKLRDSEERFRRIVENTENIIFKINSDGIFELSEGKALSALKLKPGQVVGMSAFELYKDYPDITGNIKKALDGNNVSDEIKVLVDGREVYFTIFYSPVRDSNGNVTSLVGEAIDITDKKESELVLQAGKERFRLLYERAPLAYQSLDENGNIIEVNQAWLDLLGYSRVEAIGTWIGDYILPDYLSTLSENFPRFKARGEVSGVHFKFKHKDGREIEVEVNGKIGYGKEGKFEKTHCILHDVTEKKKIIRQLEESEKHHRIMSNTMAQGLVFQDKAGVITHANPAAEKILGLTFDQLLGRTSNDPHWRIIHEDGSDYPGEAHPTMIALKTGKKVNDAVMGVYNPKTDDTRWILVNAVPLFRKDENEPYQVYATFTDISERKRIEEEIQRSHEQLAAANKDLEAFTYSVSHDLKAPLRHIIGFSSFLHQKLGERMESDELLYLEKIQKSSERMAELIDDLLSFSRVSEGEMKLVECNLGTIAQNALEDFKKVEPFRKSEITIQEGMTVMADRSLIRAVLQNIISNAWKFSRNRDVTRIEFATKTVGNRETFYIRDNGVGFDMNNSEKLFEPFRRLHPSRDYEGTGIGLATVQRIIHRHGGKIWAESKPDEGATFYFTLK